MRRGFRIAALLGVVVGACASDGMSPGVPPAQQTLMDRCEAFQPERDPTVKLGRKLEAPNPSAPRNGSRQGVACAEVTVTTAGEVVDPKIVYTTDAEFARRFVRALERWRYEPATRDSEPVEVRIVLSATFTVR